MSEWTLVDCAKLVTDLDDLPRVNIQSEAQLREQLNGFRHRLFPPVVELISPTGEILYMGIGSDLSGIRWMKEPMRDHFKMAVADRIYSEGGMEFRYQGDVAGFREKYVLPTDKTIEAAVHFYASGQLPDWLSWAEWDPKAHRLEVPTPERNGVPAAPPGQELPAGDELAAEQRDGQP